MPPICFPYYNIHIFVIQRCNIKLKLVSWNQIVTSPLIIQCDLKNASNMFQELAFQWFAHSSNAKIVHQKNLGRKIKEIIIHELIIKRWKIRLYHVRLELKNAIEEMINPFFHFSGSPPPHSHPPWSAVAIHLFISPFCNYSDC